MIKPTTPPLGFWLLSVQEQNRVRFSHEIFDRAEWLHPDKTEPSECLAVLTEAHGIQLWPIDGPTAKRISEAKEALGSASTEAKSTFLKLARYIATSWRIHLNREPGAKRVSITIPSEARDMGLLPGVKELIVVFLFGDMIEIWPHKQWIDYCRCVASEWKTELQKFDQADID